MTRSAPFIIKVPPAVIMGKSPIKISCSLISSVSMLRRRTLTFKGAAYVASLALHSSSVYLGFSSME